MWELTSGFTSFFSSGDDDNPPNEEGYYVWNLWIKIAFCTRKLWGVVSGSESKPPDSDTIGKSNWERRTASLLCSCTSAAKPTINKTTNSWLWYFCTCNELPEGYLTSCQCGLHYAWTQLFYSPHFHQTQTTPSAGTIMLQGYMDM
jgi:hypothetical protein